MGDAFSKFFSIERDGRMFLAKLLFNPKHFMKNGS